MEKLVKFPAESIQSSQPSDVQICVKTGLKTWFRRTHKGLPEWSSMNQHLFQVYLSQKNIFQPIQFLYLCICFLGSTSKKSILPHSTAVFSELKKAAMALTPHLHLLPRTRWIAARFLQSFRLCWTRYVTSRQSRQNGHFGGVNKKIRGLYKISRRWF